MKQEVESTPNTWDIVIQPTRSIFDFGLREIWAYRDLLLLLVRREFVTIYKQTLLGPLWYLIQPVMYTVFLVFVFGEVAELSADGMPKPVFYLAGITLWNYFSECAKKSSQAFISNANIFGKVYFPRMILPLSIIISNLMRLGIQYMLFLGVMVYFLATDSRMSPNSLILLTPVIFLILTMFGLGVGIILSSLSAKYRDLRFAVEFGIQLLMYTTTVAYPLSMMEGKTRMFMLANPITSLIEAFRAAYLGAGVFEWSYLAYSFVASVVLIFVGMLIFNRIEKTFVDTV